MHLRTKYRVGVANGERCIIVAVHPYSQTECVTVQFIGPDTPVHYRQEEVNELGLAYAITTHKAQGSEFDAITLVLEPNMYRSLVYTAVTRAKQKLRIIGDLKYFDLAVSRNPVRRTLLKDWIERLNAAAPLAAPNPISAPPVAKPGGRKPHPRQGRLCGD